MKRNLLLLLLGLSVVSIRAQLKSPADLSFGKNKSTAKKLLKRGAVEAAVTYLEAAAEKKKGNKRIEKLLAPTALQARNYAEAAHYFSLLMERDKKQKNPELIYYKATALQQQEKYDEAILLFNQFKKLAVDDKFSDLVKATKKAIEGCKLGIAQKDSSVKKEFKAIHLEGGINTTADEQSVAFQNEKNLLFSTWNNSLTATTKKIWNFADRSTLQLAQQQGNTWQLKESFSALKESTDGQYVTTPSFSDDGHTLYFSMCKEEVALQWRCDIYKSDMANGVWQKAEKLNTSINLPTANNLWPHVGKAPGGEEALYFSSNRNPGKGYDLFYAVRNGDGSFQRAKTLGAPINTKGDEIAPFYDYESNTLFFSTNGMGGLGGFDVVGAQRLVIGDFLNPENLGMPVNSGADDYGFVNKARKNTGFVISNRQSVTNPACTTCNDDVWLLQTSRIYPAVKGEVVRWNVGNKEAVTDAYVSLAEITTNTQAGYMQAIDGTFFFDVEAEQNYKLVLKREGAADIEKTFSTVGLQKSDTFFFSLVVDSIPAVKDFVGAKLATVFWDYDKFQLTPTAPDSLKKVIDFYTANPQYIIEVGSHTDSKGDSKYNLQLSEKRGAAVVKFLLNKKIPAKRIVNKPYGEDKPLAPNTTSDGQDNPEGRALNRRTEFTVIEKVKE